MYEIPARLNGAQAFPHAMSGTGEGLKGHSHSIIGKAIYLIEKQSENIFQKIDIPTHLPSKRYCL